MATPDTASNEIATFGSVERHGATARLLAYNTRDAREDRIAAEVVDVPDAGERAYGRERVIVNLRNGWADAAPRTGYEGGDNA